MIPQPVKSLAVVAAKKYFLPYRDALVDAFKVLGVQAFGVERLEEAGDADGVLVVGMHYYPKASQNLQERTVLGAIHTEQLPTWNAGALAFGSARMRVFLRDVRQYDFIADWSPAIATMLAKRFPRVFHLDHGAIDALLPDDEEGGSQHIPANRKYDVVFIGSPDGIDQRRAAILSAIKQRFTVYPKHSGLWGEAKRQAMAQAAIVLNLHYDQSAAFEAPRVWEALSLGCFLISEPMAQSQPFLAGRDYAEAFTHLLPEAIARYLEDSASRREIALQGARTAHAFPITATAARLLQQFQIEAALLRSPAYARRRRWYRRTGVEWLRDPARC